MIAVMIGISFSMTSFFPLAHVFLWRPREIVYLPEKRGLRSRQQNTSNSIINELLSLSLITSSTVVTSQSLLDVSETQYGEVEEVEARTCLKLKSI